MGHYLPPREGGETAGEADMTELPFVKFPKIYRLSRPCVITEKLDGTNAQVNIVRLGPVGDDVDYAVNTTGAIATRTLGDRSFELMYAGSRTRWLTPESDNMGFARWVKEHSDWLWALGPGQHFGEWWGSKIQRGYGLTVKRFSLFNTALWMDCYQNADDLKEGQRVAPECCSVVPVLYEGPFDSPVVNFYVDYLRKNGSVAAPGFMQPEGVVVFHTPGGYLFKKTLEGDEAPKGQPR
jgi:hypothetical protein